MKMHEVSKRAAAILVGGACVGAMVAKGGDAAAQVAFTEVQTTARPGANALALCWDGRSSTAENVMVVDAHGELWSGTTTYSGGAYRLTLSDVGRNYPALTALECVGGAGFVSPGYHGSFLYGRFSDGTIERLGDWESVLHNGVPTFQSFLPASTPVIEGANSNASNLAGTFNAGSATRIGFDVVNNIDLSYGLWSAIVSADGFAVPAANYNFIANLTGRPACGSIEHFSGMSAIGSMWVLDCGLSLPGLGYVNSVHAEINAQATGLFANTSFKQVAGISNGLPNGGFPLVYTVDQFGNLWRGVLTGPG